MIGIYLLHKAELISYATDSWQERTETVVPIGCRVEWKSKMVTDKEGNNVWSSGVVFILPDQAVDHEMIFRYAGRDYGILGITDVVDFTTLYKELTIA